MFKRFHEPSKTAQKSKENFSYAQMSKQNTTRKANYAQRHMAARPEI
jgi:hypothetical protein